MIVTVNGKEHQYDGDPAMPLLWYVRDVLGLTGSKFGCGSGLCGACTMHLDGKSVRSCVLPVQAAEGLTVVTIEGLDPDGDHPAQKAWREHNVPQCGYCQAGQIMQAASLLAENNTPTDKQITEHMSGNLCRCGCYQRIEAAVKSAAIEQASKGA
ncbi:(2Fe-2S)-binding protein [Granulosicoccus antarcticus]|uniref:Isoquinoline 1-oxidoreductase subunit alpha n=1 Tax=Granulosicoccus antarcticus IMCC3135 TaxID=1192854 RepID=A0A2Z2NK71_9GAMM|nr:(2Fe-2S)-binding protein [Granulosicoccus antarcticus]ASJ70905.1 Isoquinoline 1-oxidoreductase subunit alpha [Granulosicoccus antarcticus IMCC3135]